MDDPPTQLHSAVTKGGWIMDAFASFLSSFYTFFNDTARFLLQCSIPLKNVAVSHKKVSELGIKCHIFSKEAYSKTLVGSNHLDILEIKIQLKTCWRTLQD